MTEHHKLRDALLAIEPAKPERREQLQQEMQNMFVRKLSTTTRAVLSVIMVADFGAAVLCGSLVVTETGLPWLARIGLSVGVLFGLAWGAMFVKVLRRGEMNIRQDGQMMARMVWCFTLLMVIFMVVLGMTTPDRLKGILVILQSFVFLIGAAVYWLTQRIEDAQLNVTERLLRMELQLTELMQGRRQA